MEIVFFKVGALHGKYLLSPVGANPFLKETGSKFFP